MCGIVGVLGQSDASSYLLRSLRLLEYRGYDSAGIATVTGSRIDQRRAEGKLTNLENLLAGKPLLGKLGIGHTRWATHGAPSARNAHPHSSGPVSVVHNGIIENFRKLRDELIDSGFEFSSDTDTEVVAHLVHRELANGHTPAEAVRRALRRIEGSFALAFIFAGEEDLMIAARRGSPLALGHGDGEMFLGSDAIALAPFTSNITYLEDGDWAVLSRSKVEIFDSSDVSVRRPAMQSKATALLVDKGNYRHYMAKEIAEQPDVLSRTLANYIDMATLGLKPTAVDFSNVSHVTISACGTAQYAGQVAKYWFERYAQLPVEIDVASEFRYREVPLPPHGLALFISQSGETADTLAALRYCKSRGQSIAAVVNVPTSTIARESEHVLPTFAGPEIGVASTKAFTCQLAVLACLAVAAGRARGIIGEARERELLAALIELPRLISAHLRDQSPYERLAKKLARARDVIFLGRGMSYPIALEGALKLKEISYIHAEGYAAGELKHGPIALIDAKVPVVVVAPGDDLYEKTVSNMQEVAARGGRIVYISDEDPDRAGCKPMVHIETPALDRFAQPIFHAIPMQLIAYWTAVALKREVDQPRNLAKSVTVE